MKIVISSPGRFHVADLARELTDCGHEVTFISALPSRQLRQYGFNPHRHISFLFLAPLIWLGRRTQSDRVKTRAQVATALLFDGLVSASMPPTDLFIGMAGLSVKSGQTAKNKYGAQFFLERGSLHAVAQKRILEAIPNWKKGKPGMSDFFLKRNAIEYANADTIVVPSRLAVESFVEQGVEAGKLFRNPYGVDLNMFSPTEKKPDSRKTIIYVGTWSMQKGCDVLANAWRRLPGVRLLHVGSVLDCSLPTESDFKHVDPVPQWTLRDWYAQGDVFALASRQEGLALVQVQALACGLPLVCTDRTGGADLAKMIPDPEMVNVAPHDDPDAFSQGMRKALRKADSMSGIRDGLGQARSNLSWKAYGKRYSDFLMSRRTKP